MNYRRWIAVLEWSLLAAVIAVHLGLWYAEEWLVAAPGTVGSLLAEAAPFVRGTVLIFVTVWGPGHPALRLVPAAIVALMILDQNLWADRLGIEHTRLLFDGVCVATILAAIGMRIAGMCIARTSGVTDDRSGTKFSIRMLLAATTLVAILVAMATWLRPYFAEEALTVEPYLSFLRLRGSFEDDVRLSDIIRWGAMTASLVAIALLATSAVLLRGVAWMRVSLLLAVAPLVGTYVAWLTASSLDTSVTFAAFLTTLALLVAGTALPLRLLDFRLQRLAKLLKPETPAASTLAPGSAGASPSRTPHCVADLGLEPHKPEAPAKQSASPLAPGSAGASPSPPLETAR